MGCYRLERAWALHSSSACCPGEGLAGGHSERRSGRARVQDRLRKLEMVNESVNGVSVVSDQGQRMAWQFDKTVIEKLKAFKPGDPSW